MNRLFKAGFGGAAFMALSVTAMALGPEWEEDGDADDLPPGQATIGFGSLGFISGHLGGSPLNGPIDLVDMFLIRIVNVMDFRVTTDPEDGILGGASANFDTQLWLFQPVAGGRLDAALGIVGNDDHFELGGQFSLLLPDPTDGCMCGGVMAEGLYYIAITRSNHDPFSGAGGPKDNIFDQMDPQEISGPDGDGGREPITSWNGDQGGKFDGNYTMALRGVEFAIPAPGALGLFIIAAVGARRRRRRSLRG